MHVIGTAGHVDHGKSSLIQRLTGLDPDRLAEEKRRGLTIDLGFAWLPLPSGNEIGIVDVPGHERFIKNMLAGAGGISICLFVVAANEGWKPQSAEHLGVIDILGIRQGVVALTKSDTVDKETLELAAAEVEDRIAPSSLAGAPVIACSAQTGDGMADLLHNLDDVVTSAPPASDGGTPRLWIDRVFTIAGAGTVVTGTLAGGTLSAGDEIMIAPEGRRARIRSIQSHKKEVPSIPPGNRVALNLAGLDRQGAERGDAIVLPMRRLATRRVHAMVRVLTSEIMRREHHLTAKGAHLLYVGSAETPVTIKLLGADRLSSGDEGFAELYLRHPLPLLRGDRFVLRDAGRVTTFGGGEILDPLPDPARRGDQDVVLRLRELAGAGPEAALRTLVSSAGYMDGDEALFRSGATSPGDGVTTLGPLLVSPDYLATLEAETLAALGDYHRANPLHRGMPREELRASIGLPPDAFDPLVARTEHVVEEGAAVRLASFAVDLAPEQARVRDQLLKRIEGAGFAPPLAKELGADRGLLRALVDSGDLVAIGDFFLTAAQAREARARVRERLAEAGPQTVAQIRDLLGTSRKYAVPLCEWLDATGATRRRGDVRDLGPTA